MNDISIDIESLGTRFDAPIISIGAVRFDRKTGKLGGEFYAEVDLQSAIDSGKVSADTLMWWMTQSPAARQVFAKGNERQHLSTALRGLSDFVRGAGMSSMVWGNGATFDITILEHAYSRCTTGLLPPWGYTNIRDMRTIVECSELDPKTFARVGVHHNALDDAKFQAIVISACWQQIVSNRPGAGAQPSTKRAAPAKTAELQRAVEVAVADDTGGL